MRPLGAQTPGEFQFLASLSGKSQRTQGLGRHEVRGGAELAGGMAQQAALKRDRFGDKPGKIQGDALDAGGGAAPAANRTATKRTCEATRAISACHQDSSSRASSAICAR